MLIERLIVFLDEFFQRISEREKYKRKKIKIICKLNLVEIVSQAFYFQFVDKLILVYEKVNFIFIFVFIYV